MKSHSSIVQEWLQKAENDYMAAQIILQAKKNPLPLDTVCFHCQQATEKYLKAYLSSHNQKFPKTHFLPDLLELCKRIDPEFVNLEDSLSLTDYAVITRYPGLADEIKKEEANEAFQITGDVRNFIKIKLK